MSPRPPSGLQVATLVACLLLTASVVYPLTVPHAAHHVHHTASMHASVLCAWLCAAGQGIETSAPVLYATLASCGLSALLPPAPPSTVPGCCPSTRGPPPVV